MTTSQESRMAPSGLSDQLKTAFPNLKSYPRPLVEGQEIKDPDWVAGFTTGEGCFKVIVQKHNTKIGFRVTTGFTITQHIRDEFLMKSFMTYFGCGGV